MSLTLWTSGYIVPDLQSAEGGEPQGQESLQELDSLLFVQYEGQQTLSIRVQSPQELASTDGYGDCVCAVSGAIDVDVVYSPWPPFADEEPVPVLVVFVVVVDVPEFDVLVIFVLIVDVLVIFVLVVDVLVIFVVVLVLEVCTVPTELVVELVSDACQFVNPLPKMSGETSTYCCWHTLGVILVKCGTCRSSDTTCRRCPSLAATLAPASWRQKGAH